MRLSYTDARRKFVDWMFRLRSSLSDGDLQPTLARSTVNFITIRTFGFARVVNDILGFVALLHNWPDFAKFPTLLKRTSSSGMLFVVNYHGLRELSE